MLIGSCRNGQRSFNWSRVVFAGVIYANMQTITAYLECFLPGCCIELEYSIAFLCLFICQLVIQWLL